MTNPALDSYLSELAHKHQLAINDLDQKQFVEVMRQMILSGDLRKNVKVGYGHDDRAVTQSNVTYLPYQGVELLRSENIAMRRQLADIKKAIGA